MKQDKPKETTLKHILIIMAKVKDRVLKAGRMKKQVIYKGNLARLSTDFLETTLQARREWQDHGGGQGGWAWGTTDGGTEPPFSHTPPRAPCLGSGHSSGGHYNCPGSQEPGRRCPNGARWAVGGEGWSGQGLRAAARVGGVEGAAGADRGAENKPRQRTVSRTALAAAPAGLRSLLT